MLIISNGQWISIFFFQRHKKENLWQVYNSYICNVYSGIYSYTIFSLAYQNTIKKVELAYLKLIRHTHLKVVSKMLATPGSVQAYRLFRQFVCLFGITGLTGHNSYCLLFDFKAAHSIVLDNIESLFEILFHTLFCSGFLVFFFHVFPSLANCIKIIGDLGSQHNNIKFLVIPVQSQKELHCGSVLH